MENEGNKVSDKCRVVLLMNHAISSGFLLLQKQNMTNFGVTPPDEKNVLQR